MCIYKTQNINYVLNNKNEGGTVVITYEMCETDNYLNEFQEDKQKDCKMIKL